MSIPGFPDMPKSARDLLIEYAKIHPLLKLQEETAKHALQRQSEREMERAVKALGLDRQDYAKNLWETINAWLPEQTWIKQQQDALDGFGLMGSAPWIKDLSQTGAMVAALEMAKTWKDPFADIHLGLNRYLDASALDAIRPVLNSLVNFDVFHELSTASEETREKAKAVVQTVTAAAAQEQTPQGVVQRFISAILLERRPTVQILLLLWLWNVMSSLTQATVAPVLDHYVKRYLNEPPQASAKHVKESAVEAAGGAVLLAEFRYVSAKTLAVRPSPRANARGIGELKFGQLVHVIRTEGDFTLVLWRSGDGTIHMQGWVFSRYLSRFT